MKTLINLDRKFTPFLFKAINAVQNSAFISSEKYDIESLHISFEDLIHKRDG